MDTPVYFLNLDCSPERRRSIEQQLSRLGMVYHRVPGVDGSLLSEEEIKSCYSWWRSILFYRCHDLLTRGEIGCYLTHLRAYQMILDEGVPSALVVEDDAVLSDRLLAFLGRLDRLPKFELITFLHSVDRNREWALETPFGDEIIDGVRLTQFGRRGMKCTGAHAYLITREACIKALQHAYPICRPLDDYLYTSWASKLKYVYGTSVPLADLLPKEECPSDIWHNDRRGRVGTAPFIVWNLFDLARFFYSYIKGFRSFLAGRGFRRMSAR